MVNDCFVESKLFKRIAEKSPVEAQILELMNVRIVALSFALGEQQKEIEKLRCELRASRKIGLTVAP